MLDCRTKRLSATSGARILPRDFQPWRVAAEARRGERGAGSLKAIVWTMILAAFVYVGVKVIPVLVNEYEFQDGIQNIARFASVNRQDNGKIREAVLKEAEKDDLPIQAEDIKVEGSERKCPYQCGLFGDGGLERVSVDTEFSPGCQQQCACSSESETSGANCSQSDSGHDRSVIALPAGDDFPHPLQDLRNLTPRSCTLVRGGASNLSIRITLGQFAQ